MDLSQYSKEELEAELERRNQPVREDLVRTDFTGDKIFLLKNGETHWIQNPDTFQVLGGSFEMVKTLTKEEFNVFVKGEDIGMGNVSQYA